MPVDPQDQLAHLAEHIRAEAPGYPFPPTPDLAGRERHRLATGMQRRQAGLPLPIRLALLSCLLLAALLLVPDVRAAALRIFQIGVVQVQLVPAPPTPAPLTPTAAPVPTPAPPLPPNLGLSGATTLADAAIQVVFPLRLPTYPPELGPPDLIYLQDLDGAAVLMVWLDPNDPTRPQLSLHTLSSAVFVQKTLFGEEMERLAETSVNGTPALWVRGPHLVEVTNGSDRIALRRIVDGDTLIWTAGELTYRLETELPLEEAIRIAESLR